MAHALALAATLAAAAALGAAGCGSDPPPPPKGADAVKSAGVPSATAASAPKKDVVNETSGSIHIEDRILKACGDIPEAHFAFDSAAIAEQAEASLVALARCFVSGPLKGKGIKLEGHADPRGTASYNVGLGQKRSGSVGIFLGAKGMEAGRISTSSVGAAEATGTDEQGWAKDRRVEVFLAE